MEFERFVMLYEINWRDEEEVRIFGDEFVKANGNKAKLIFNNRLFPLFSILPFSEIEEGEETVKFEIILDKNVFNKSYMFKNCKYLIQLSAYEHSKIFKSMKDIENIDNTINENISDFEVKNNIIADINDDDNDDNFSFFINDDPLYYYSEISTNN